MYNKKYLYYMESKDFGPEKRREMVFTESNTIPILYDDWNVEPILEITITNKGLELNPSKRLEELIKIKKGNRAKK